MALHTRQDALWFAMSAAMPGQKTDASAFDCIMVVPIRQFTHLGRCRLDQFLAAVAGVHAPKSGHAIKYPVAVGIVYVTAIRTRDDARLLLVQVFVVGERVQVMVLVQFLPVRSRVFLKRPP